VSGPRQIDDAAMRRLAFIKYLQSVAAQQSRQRPPMCAAAILTFHDAVELFLVLAAEFHDPPNLPKRPDFDAYWERLTDVLPRRLETQRAMRALNSTRVNLKHKGIPPATDAIAGFRASVAEFFAANTPLVFGIDFENISMIDLVANASARESLHGAEQLMRSGKAREASNALSDAFGAVVHKAQDDLRIDIRRMSQSWHTAQYQLNDYVPEDTQRYVTAAVGELQSQFAFLALGLDFREFARFRGLMPSALSAHDFQWALDFIVETALVVQQVREPIEQEAEQSP